jgi:hypothetical protein
VRVGPSKNDGCGGCATGEGSDAACKAPTGGDAVAGEGCGVAVGDVDSGARGDTAYGAEAKGATGDVDGGDDVDVVVGLGDDIVPASSNKLSCCNTAAKTAREHRTHRCHATSALAWTVMGAGNAPDP